jgi:hypothetical protein
VRPYVGNGDGGDVRRISGRRVRTGDGVGAGVAAGAAVGEGVRSTGAGVAAGVGVARRM